ncbi:MAG: Hsp20/alpha crystallin family protein [Candidatus Odinarchaeia archaeon]
MEWFEEFRRIREKMFNEFRKMFEDKFFEDYQLTQVGEPLVYGYSVYVGPDGVPIVREYGNFRPEQFRRQNGEKKFEPYIDRFIDKEKQKVVVTAEIPGVNKEDLVVKVYDDKLYIKSKTKGREFEKTISLGTTVDPKSVKSVYKNGILEVTAKISEDDKGVSVPVE